MLNENRRKYPRIIYSAAVDVKSSGKKAASCKGIIKNLSVGGLALETESELASGEKFVFEFYLPDKSLIKSEGSQIWELRSKASNFYGIEFSYIGFFDKLKLKRFVKIKLNEMQG